MTQTFVIEELDDASRSYLRAARDRKGAGVPGVFLPGSNYLPIVALIGGIAVLIGIAWWTLPPLDDPLKTAMLQTAGLLLGGWLILYAVRTWIAAAGQNYLGHFFLADPLHLWQAKGASVKSTDLAELEHVKGTDNFNEGNYQNTTLTLSFTDGGYSVNVKDPDHRLEGFLHALVTLRSGQTQQVSMPPEALGFLAKQTVGLEMEPVGDSEDAVVVPAQPRRENRARSGILAYLVIVAVAVAGVFLLKPVNVVLRDDAVFHMVINREPPELRAYLVDERNVRHRQEVEKKLAQFYQAPLQRLKQTVKGEVGEEFIALVTSLQSAVQPFVSLRVKERTKAVANVPFLTAEQIKARERAVHQIISMGLTRAVGDKLIGIVEVVEDVPALIDVNYTLVPDAKRPDELRIDWTVGVRRNADVDVKAAKIKTWTSPTTANQLGNAINTESDKTLQALTGVANPQVNPPFPRGVPPFPVPGQFKLPGK